MGYYESLKTDNKNLDLKSGVWYALEAGGKSKLVPPASSRWGAMWVFYANIKSPKIGGATEATFRWVRNPGTSKADETGRVTYNLKKGGTTWLSHVWTFQAIKGQPVSLEVCFNGKVTLTTRELKLAWDVDK